MRKQLLLVGFLIAIATQSLAQGVTVQNANPTSSIANRGSYIADSIFRLGTRDTVKPAWWNPSWSFNGAFQLGLDGNPYYYSGGKWNGFAGGSGGSGTVTSVTQGYGMVLTPSPITTSGSVRVDTAQVSTKANVVSLTSNKVPYTGANANVDLGAYTLSSHDLVVNHASGSGSAATITKGGSGEALTVVKVSGAGNAASITGGVTEIETLHLTNDLADAYIASAATWNAKVSTSQLADSTLALRGVIDTKQNNSDTTTWDATKKNLADTSATLRALIGGGGVSAASVAEINTGTDNTKFASPLGLEGSKYVEQDGTKNYAVTTGTATAYVLTTAPSFTPATGTVISVKFHLANTGAATINVNGSGAVALQKDLSTALVANDIPINSEYTIRRTSTGWLVTDLGFAGINLSARLLGALSDETGTGVSVFGTSPTFTTSVVGGATFAAFNTVTTNLSLGGAATTMTIGGTPTTAITHTYSGNATANTITKTLNFGTGGASGSTTAINIGSATSGATTNTKLNITPASDATGDLWYRNASGFMTRLGIGTTGQVLTVAAGLPSWAAAGAGSGWAINGNAVSTGDWIGTSNAKPWIGKVNNQRSMFIDAASTYNAIYGYGAAPSLAGSYNVVIGGNACTVNTASTNSVFIGTSVASTQSGGDKNICISGSGGQLPNTSGNDQVNIGNVIWAAGANGTGTTPAGRIGIGTHAPNAGSILELSSTTQGFLLTRMTGTQAAAITPKEEGLIVYVKDATGGFAAKGWYGWNGAAWEKLNP